MKNTTQRPLAIVALTAIVALAFPAFQQAGPKYKTTTASVDPALEAVFLDSAPEGAITILEARKNIEPGATVTISGRVAGTKQPFAPGYAVMILADETLATCEKNPADKCKTPWDACCVPADEIAASRVLIQVLGEDGRPLGVSLKNVKGLTELDDVVVTGVIADGSTSDNVIINATGIFPNPS